MVFLVLGKEPCLPPIDLSSGTQKAGHAQKLDQPEATVKAPQSAQNVGVKKIIKTPKSQSMTLTKVENQLKLEGHKSTYKDLQLTTGKLGL